ncbi:MAG: TonB family protein [Myxococcota bacterium]
MNQPQGPQQEQEGAGGKPGAMTMAMRAVASKPTGPKVLRIGLIQGGKIVEERIIRTRETVSVGTSEKNHFIVATEGMPPQFELFQLVGGDYILNFTDWMKGRVGLPGGVQDLEQLRESGGARNAGTHWQVKLSETSKGKIVMGDVTLLFQFVTPPPVMPRPQLPAAARGGFVKSIDWLFTAFIVFSYMLFFGFIIYLENADWPIDDGIVAVPESAARLVFEEPVPPPEPEEAEPTEEGEAEEDDDAQEEVAEAPADEEPSQSGDEGPAEDAEASAEARARMADEAASQAESMILGALGDDGALSDVLAGGAVTGSAEDILDQAAGVGVASGESSGNLRTRSGGGGSGEGGSLGGLAKAGGGGATKARDTGEVKERKIRGDIDLGSGGDVGGAGQFDSSAVVRQIRARLRAIQNCYESELRKDPSLAGKVAVEFTIEERGNVTGAKAVQNTTGSSAVGSCVVRTISRFRFNPGPEGGSVAFSYPFVFAPQN